MSDLPSSRAADGLNKAVHRAKAASPEGILERIFTFAFRGLVYPQIWEDPDVDMRALALKPHSRMVTIASGGCNVLSYLTADPQEIVAVDLNRAHVALTKLKLAAARLLADLRRLLPLLRRGGRKSKSHRLPPLPARSDRRRDARPIGKAATSLGRRRITLFSRDLYHHGLLGYFIGAAHFVARLYGADPKEMIRARTLDEQRSFYETALAPLFDKRLVRWATSKKMSLYGLGIPPAQYEALASAGAGDMALVLRSRLERLACAFSLSENYFAWQAFGRGYASDMAGPLPPYLKREHYEVIRERAGRVEVLNRSVTDHLAGEPAESLDAYVLLDAQDWMRDDQLNALWAEITRTAKPGARVVFRTAAEPSLLPGRVEDAILDRWTYEAEQSRVLGAEDRSSIYGGFHLYVRKG